MKRDFLLGLGIAEDVAKRIMEENGRDIEREKAKLTAAAADRDEAIEALREARERLMPFEGVDVDALRAEIVGLRVEIADGDKRHRAEMDRQQREAETALFLAGKRFVNDATREHFSARINEQIEGGNAGSREDILRALTTGEDGEPLGDVFKMDDAKRATVNMPPAQRIDPAKMAELGRGAMGRLQGELNRHRIIK